MTVKKNEVDIAVIREKVARAEIQFERIYGQIEELRDTLQELYAESEVSKVKYVDHEKFNEKTTELHKKLAELQAQLTQSPSTVITNNPNMTNKVAINEHQKKDQDEVKKEANSGVLSFLGLNSFKQFFVLVLTGAILFGVFVGAVIAVVIKVTGWLG